MAPDFTKDFNDGLSAVHESRLSQYNDAKLNDFLNAAQRWEASGNPISQTGLVINAVRHELNHRQKDRHYKDSIVELNRINKEALKEQNRLHGIQIENDRQLAKDAALDNDKKHGQTLAISKEANQLSKRAVLIAILSVVATVIIGGIGVIVAHLDSSRPSTSDTNAPRAKETSPQSAMPQIVLPTPKPTPTNLIQTNVSQKK